MVGVLASRWELAVDGMVLCARGGRTVKRPVLGDPMVGLHMRDDADVGAGRTSW